MKGRLLLTISLIVVALTTHAQAKSNNKFQELKPLTLKEVHDEVNCLALNVYHEARGLDLRQQSAVAHATMNRLADKRFPKTVCGVVYQKHQFSWTDLIRHKMPTEIRAWHRAQVIAELVYQEQLPDITNGATFYYEKTIKKPKWSKDMKVKYAGDHIFLASK